MIDMTEEPEDEMDLLFKAQNIKEDGYVDYVIPIEPEIYEYGYMPVDYYKYLQKLFDNVL